MPAATSSRFRRRNLNFKTHLSIVREGDLDDSRDGDFGDGENPEPVSTVKTGVDEVEEREHHLQAVIKASQAAAKGLPGGKVAQTFIPTPDAIKSNVPYHALYRSIFAQPATYIRFSSTVEDCTGTSYCMDEDDKAFLTKMNASVEDDVACGKAGARVEKQCTEDQFEAIMNAYEETSQSRQPFASVDNTPVLPFEEMVGAFDDFENDDLDEVARAFAEEIYAYWKDRKIEHGSKVLMPKLKTLNMDQPSKDADDSDPYICFRRREVKQMRRTRGRDSQVVERLKKLRRELEDGRQLLHWVKTREEFRKDDMKVSRQLFEQRATVRDLKHTLKITDDDDDLLVNQPKPKRRAIEMPQPSARQVPAMVRRQDSLLSNMPDFDIVQYREKFMAREANIAQQIETGLKVYEKWNLNFVDQTQAMLEGAWKPEDDFEDPKSLWVSIDVKQVPREPQQQPTPPESVVDGDPMDVDKPEHQSQDDVSDDDETQVRWATPPDTDSSEDQRPRYRQRRGRGGLMLDQRRPRGRPRKAAQTKAEEIAKYDVDSGEEDDEPDHMEVTDSKVFRLRQHLRQFDLRRQVHQCGGYHSRSASLATSINSGSRH